MCVSSGIVQSLLNVAYVSFAAFGRRLEGVIALSQKQLGDEAQNMIQAKAKLGNETYVGHT